MICQTCVCARSSRRTLRAQRCAGRAFRSFALFVPLLALSVTLSGLSIGIEVVPSAACRCNIRVPSHPSTCKRWAGCPGRTSASSRYRRNRSAPASHSSICQVSSAELRVRQAQQSRATGALRCAVAAQRTAAVRCPLTHHRVRFRSGCAADTALHGPLRAAHLSSASRFETCSNACFSALYTDMPTCRRTWTYSTVVDSTTDRV